MPLRWADCEASFDFFSLLFSFYSHVIVTNVLYHGAANGDANKQTLNINAVLAF